MPQLVIFDFDGTLADSRDAIVASMAQALRGVGAGELDPQRQADWIGLPLNTMVAELLTWAGHFSETRHAEVIRLYRAAYADLCTRHTRLFGGMDMVLARLHGAGKRLAVATSKSQTGFMHAAGHLGILPRFDTIRTEESVARGKPHPDMVLSILAELGVAADEAVMVGDTEYDMNMGRAAGVTTVGVLWGAHDRARLAACSPSHLVPNAAALADLLLS